MKSSIQGCRSYDLRSGIATLMSRMLLGLVLFSTVAYAQPVWEKMFSISTIPPLNAFAFDSAGTTWAATAEGMFRYEGAAGIWESRGLLNAVELGVAHDGSLLAATGEYVVRSTDRGGNWTDSFRVGGKLRFHNSPDGKVFGITTGTVYRSIDNGRSWQSLPIYNNHEQSPYFNLAFASNGTILVSNGGSLKRSTDGGDTWQTVATPASLVEITPVLDGDLLATGWLGSRVGLYRSTDNGATWKGGVGMSLTEIVVGSDRTLHAVRGDAGSEGFYSSSDNGNNWSRTGERHPDLLAAAPNGDLWITENDSILVSTDEGKSWQPAWRSGGLVLATGAIAEAPDGSIMSSGGGRLYRSSADANEWADVHTDFKADLVGIDSLGAIYASETRTDWFPYGDRTTVSLRRSSDGGRTWQFVPGLQNFRLIDLSQPGLMAAAFVGQMYVDAYDNAQIVVSTDSGTSWHAAGIGLAAYELAVTSRGVLLASADAIGEMMGGRNLYLSRDSGATWERMLPDLQLERLRVAPNGFIYLTGSEEIVDSATGRSSQYGRLLRSTDDGRTWKNLLDSGYVADLFITPSSELYCRIRHTYYDWRTQFNVHSSDNGESWTRLETHYPYSAPRYLLALPTGEMFAMNYDTLYYRDTLYRSDDRGRTWNSIQFNLPNVALPYSGFGIPHVLAVRHGYLFVAASGILHRASMDAAGLDEVIPVPPAGLHIGNPRPHPLTLSSAVPLALDAPTELRVTIVDLLGRELRVIHEGLLPAGTTELTIERGELPPGIYGVLVQSSSGSATRMIVVE